MENPEVQPKSSESNLALPVPAIVCIAIGAYLVVIVLILVIRQVLLKRGLCASGQCCGKEGEPCCECCVGCSESLNCCNSPNIESCLDSICPKRRKTDCADIIMCQCCADPENGCCACCGQDSQICDCGNCDCQCNCQTPNCDNINCCCFQINSHQPPEGEGGPGWSQGDYNQGYNQERYNQGGYGQGGPYGGGYSGGYDQPDVHHYPTGPRPGYGRGAEPLSARDRQSYPAPDSARDRPSGSFPPPGSTRDRPSGSFPPPGSARDRPAGSFPPPPRGNTERY